MATKTAGTNANNSCIALQFLPGLGSGMSAADIATMNQAIVAINRTLGPVGGRFDSSGILILPDSRGTIQMRPGDWLLIDNVGWPFVVPAYSIANGAWTHS